MRARALAFGLAVVTAMARPPAFAAGGAGEHFKVGPWDGAVYADIGGRYTHCAVWTTYSGKVTLVFSMSPQGFSIGLSDSGWQLDAGAGLDVRIVVDDLLDRHYRAQAVSAQTIVVVPDDPDQVIGAFRRGTGAKFYTDAGSYFPALTDSGQAIDAVMACNAQRTAAKTAPAEPKQRPSSAPAAKPAEEPSKSAAGAGRTITSTQRAGQHPNGAVATGWPQELMRLSPLSHHLVALQTVVQAMIEDVDEIVAITKARADGRVTAARALEIRQRTQAKIERETQRLEQLAGRMPDLSALPDGGEKVRDLHRVYLREIGDRMFDLASYADNLFDAPPANAGALAAGVLAYQLNRQGVPVSLELKVFQQELLGADASSPEHHLLLSRMETGKAFLDLLRVFIAAQRHDGAKEAAQRLHAAEASAHSARAETVRGRQALILALRASTAAGKPAGLAQRMDKISATYAQGFDTEDKIIDTLLQIVAQLRAPNDGSGEGPIPIETIRPLMLRQWELQRQRLRLIEEIRAML